ncbi:hypothetical protein CSB11_00290 [Candidatus Campbellbacteria bacterium]|nr:MAG: hypothetical protein CSB11_00290 [Candidatus Campbellbacteria bacterium]
MAEIINSSFIPKKEFKKKEERTRRGPRLNIFFLIALIIFLSTAIASGGVYFWKKGLQNQNNNYKQELAEKKEAFNIETIKDFSELAKRIDSAEVLLKKHYNLIPIFRYLEKNTLVDVTLTEFLLEENKQDIKVQAKGTASDLSDLQLQSREYAGNTNVSSLVLANITKNNVGETVFDLEFSVDKKYLTDRTFLLSSD